MLAGLLLLSMLVMMLTPSRKRAHVATDGDGSPPVSNEPKKDHLAYYRNKGHPGSPTKHEPAARKKISAQEPWEAKGLSTAASEDEDNSVAWHQEDHVYKRKLYPGPQLLWWCQLDAQKSKESGKTISKLLPSMQRIANEEIAPVMYDYEQSIQDNAIFILGKLGTMLSDAARAGAEGQGAMYVLTNPIVKKDMNRKPNMFTKSLTWQCLKACSEREQSVSREEDGKVVVHKCAWVSGEGYVRVLLAKAECDCIIEEGHRLVYWAHMGPPQPGSVIMHACNCKHCIAPHCLLNGNHSDNKLNKEYIYEAKRVEKAQQACMYKCNV